MDRELKDTVEFMCSADYKERFIAEREQLEIRIRKLEDVLIKDQEGTLGFELDTPYDLLRLQLEIMESYLRVLIMREDIEGD